MSSTSLSAVTPISTSSIQLTTAALSLWIPGIDAANATSEQLYASTLRRDSTYTEYVLTCEPTFSPASRCDSVSGVSECHTPTATPNCSLFTGQTYTTGSGSNVTVEMAGTTYACRRGRSKPRRRASCNIQLGTNEATRTTISASQSAAWGTAASVTYTVTSTKTTVKPTVTPSAHLCDNGKSVNSQEECSSAPMTRAKYTASLGAVILALWFLQ